MCCHNRFGVVPDGFGPIQCGAAINPAIEGTAGDDIGDNISAETGRTVSLQRTITPGRILTLTYTDFVITGASLGRTPK